jgi:Tol biopolymer transport system component
VPGSRGLWTCRWSPDGRYLAGVTISLRPEDRLRLNIYDRRANVWRPLPGALKVNTPTWSSDSRLIYYETEGGIMTVRRVRVADGSVEELVNTRDEPFVLGWSGLAADDSPLLLRSMETTNLYALKLGKR